MKKGLFQSLLSPGQVRKDPSLKSWRPATSHRAQSYPPLPSAMLTEHALHAMSGEANRLGEESVFYLPLCILPGRQWASLNLHLLFCWCTTEEKQEACLARKMRLTSWHVLQQQDPPPPILKMLPACPTSHTQASPSPSNYPSVYLVCSSMGTPVTCMAPPVICTSDPEVQSSIMPFLERGHRGPYGGRPGAPPL